MKPANQMARVLRESTELVVGPLTKVLMTMLLLVICVLMGNKIKAGRGWGNPGKGYLEEKPKNVRKVRLWVKTHSWNPMVSHRRNCL